MDNILGMGTCSHIRLSVIIPVYNAEQYLANCIDTIIANHDSDMEVLLVDDGSTDLSGDICEKYSRKDARLHVFHKENGGVSSARNWGLQRAQGEWVTFVDVDDFPTMELLGCCPGQESDLVCFNWQYTTGETEDERLENGYFQGNEKIRFLNLHLVDFVFRAPWAKLFRRSIIINSNILFDERFRLGEDTLFMLDYLAHCKVIETNSDLGYVYLRPSQSKYKLSLYSSIFYIDCFMQKYKQVNVDCKPLLLLLEYYYFIKVEKTSLISSIKWNISLGVRELQELCWEKYSLKQKAKIVLCRIWGRIIYGKTT